MKKYTTMNQDRAVAWLRGALERRVGAATRSLVAAVQAAADAASNVEELQKALENDLQFASLDAEFIAKGFLERLAEEIPSSGVPEASKESQVDQDNKKRRLAEDAVGKYFLVSSVGRFWYGGTFCRVLKSSMLKPP